jgi:hypothetical protein
VIFERLVRQAGERGSESSKAGIQVESGQSPGCVEWASLQDGTLLFFPAWLPHLVDANSSDQPRISVSCNLMFRSYTETMSKPLWTGSA